MSSAARTSSAGVFLGRPSRHGAAGNRAIGTRPERTVPRAAWGGGEFDAGEGRA
jgi:hypothetical protein